MFSTKLIQLIEDHWRGISTSFVQDLRSDGALRHISTLPESELRESGRNLLRTLGDWLTASKLDRDMIREQYEGIGRMRFAENVPLAECVRALHLFKRKTIEFVRDHTFAQSSVDVYGEEELEHSLNEFFDDLIYHEVLGYEAAMRKLAATGA
jgi:RsbT co-antagonist protein rsbRD N-terminal domain